MVRAAGSGGWPSPAGPCACQSPVCPLDHLGDAVMPDAGMIGMAVGVRRAVVLPVPRLRRSRAPSLASPLSLRLPMHLPLALRRARI